MNMRLKNTGDCSVTFVSKAGSTFTINANDVFESDENSCKNFLAYIASGGEVLGISSGTVSFEQTSEDITIDLQGAEF